MHQMPDRDLSLVSLNGLADEIDDQPENRVEIPFPEPDPVGQNGGPKFDERPGLDGEILLAALRELGIQFVPSELPFGGGERFPGTRDHGGVKRLEGIGSQRAGTRVGFDPAGELRRQFRRVGEPRLQHLGGVGFDEPFPRFQRVAEGRLRGLIGCRRLR